MESANKGKGSAAIAESANISDSKTRPVTISYILKISATWHTQDEKCKIRELQFNTEVYEMIANTDRGDLDVDAMDTYVKSIT